MSTNKTTQKKPRRQYFLFKGEKYALTLPTERKVKDLKQVTFEEDKVKAFFLYMEIYFTKSAQEKIEELNENKFTEFCEAFWEDKQIKK